MGHNVSEEKLRRRALAAPFDQWSGWLLHVDCGGASCARGRHYSVAELVRFYRGFELDQVVAALRCSVCKGPALKVKLTRQRRGKDEEVYWVRR